MKCQRQRSSPEQALIAQLIQGFAVLRKIFNTVGVISDIVVFQKAFELEPRHPQELARLIMRQRSCSITLNDERLQGLATGVGMLG